MPIGSGAKYIDAQIEPATALGMTVDEDVIIMQPDAHLEEICTNYDDWDRSKNRCIEEGPLLFKPPIPEDFIVSPDTFDARRKNHKTNAAFFPMHSGNSYFALCAG